MDNIMMQQYNDASVYPTALHATISKLQSLAIDEVIPREERAITSTDPTSSRSMKSRLSISIQPRSVTNSVWSLEPVSSSTMTPNSGRDDSTLASPFHQTSSCSNVPPSPTLHTRRLVHALEDDDDDSPFEEWSRRSVSSSMLSTSTNTPSYSPQEIPFFPVVPYSLEAQQPQPPTTHSRMSQYHFSSVALTRSHLLQLACASTASSYPSSSVPSSANSSCPSSPLLSAHTLSPQTPSESMFPLGTPESPAMRSLSGLDSPLMHPRCATPDSPFRVGASSAHHSTMELTARRRAIEAIKGRDAVSRLKMVGLSSRARHVTHDRSEEDIMSSSEFETPSPLSSARPLPQQPQRPIKPLMSSQGYLNLQAAMFQHDPLSADSAAHDVELLTNYLTPLTSKEFNATIGPINSLLPREDTSTLSIDSSSSSAALSSSLSATSSSSSSLSSSSFSVASSSSNAFSLSLLPGLSHLHLSLLMNRCIARSQWRKSIPSDLLLHSFSHSDIDDLLLSVCRVSKYWRACVKEHIAHSQEAQTEITQKYTRIRQHRKMKIYRRLTHEDTTQMRMLQDEANRRNQLEQQDVEGE